ncbi:hypothetical protein D9M71_461890 [compost metagenome]
MLAEAAQAEGGVQGEHFHQPTDVGQARQQQGEQGRRQYRQAPGSHTMAAPAIAAAIETPFDALRQAAEGHQRVPAARLAKQAIEDHPGEGCQHQAH